MRGKSINLFLIDGTAGGRVKCTLANWTGVAYKIPRTELEKCKGRDDLARSGVYFLFGTDDEKGADVAYIGQAGVRKNGEGLLCRLQEHHRNAEKDYWTEAVVFTTSNNSFGPTEISWLENRFCAMAQEANRYIVKNGNEPNLGHVTEEKESELEEFFEYAKLIMGTLGHKVLEPFVSQALVSAGTDSLSVAEADALTLYLKRASRKSGLTIEATCVRTMEGFVVKKGSYIERVDSESIPSSIKARREKALNDMNIVDVKGILQEDQLFKSPSYAASFVIGGHANGLVDWRTVEGKALKDLMDEEGRS